MGRQLYIIIGRRMRMRRAIYHAPEVIQVRVEVLQRDLAPLHERSEFVITLTVQDLES